MRTFEELKDAVSNANSRNDAASLVECADELDALATTAAAALASRSRGWALFLRGDYTASLEHYHRALALHDELGDRKALAVVTGNIGLVHVSTGNYPAALDHYHRALAMYEELGDRSGVAGVTDNIGSVHRSTGNYPAALECYHRALAMCEELGNRRIMAVVTANIGSVNWRTGNYPAALEHYHRALAVHEELSASGNVAVVIGNIGLVHVSTGNYPAALEHYHRALAMHEELGDRSGVARVTGNIGNVHLETGNYSATLEHYHRALAMYEELGDRSGVAAVTGNILSAMIEVELHAEAEALLEKMDAMHIDDPDIVVQREHNRSRLQQHADNIDAAAATLLAALEIAREHSLAEKQAETHKALRDLALQRNDLAGYVEHNNEFTSITEAINGKEATQKIAMQEKQREIDAVQREHQKHMAVLHSTLPKHVAERVARGEVVNDQFDNASVIFLDIVGFTSISDRIPSGHVVHLLEQIFTTLDAVCEKHNIVKIKTIGDSYMAVAFPQESSNSEQRVTSIEERAANAALDMLTAIANLPNGLPVGLREALPEGLRVRIGMHCGPVTAGVIGTARLQYDVWGDTVNVASRMESSGEAGRIHVSEQFALLLSSSLFPVPRSLRERGALEIKGKGMMTTYWLESTSA